MEIAMFIPESSLSALLLIVLSMLCWGSWPNLLKALPGWRLEYFYIDYTLGFLMTVIVLAATAGSAGAFGFEFLERLLDAQFTETMFAFWGGFVWNAGNILLLNAIMIAGLAVAFPVASVLAITLGVGISYLTQPIGNPYWLLAGSLVLVFAAVANAQAYRDQGQASGASTLLGIALSLAAGVLVGAFPPFIARAISGEYGLDAYTVCIYFMLGAALATLIGMPLLLARPFIGAAGRLGGYFEGGTLRHVMGLAAGAIWCLGTVANFASAGLVGMAVAWGIGSGAPMVGALWGIFLWKEFRGAGRRATGLISASLTLYVAGVVLVAIAYALR
jgi:glucose uptake protein